MLDFDQCSDLTVDAVIFAVKFTIFTRSAATFH